MNDFKKIQWQTKQFFGTRKSDGAKIYISAPSFDCGWYWGFGYLGNKNEHCHLSSYQTKEHYFKTETGEYIHITEKRNKSMYDCLKDDYILNIKIRQNLWQFCELVATAYSLKETAEILGRGGSHYTTNPAKDIIINSDEVKRINEKVLPAIFDEIYKIFSQPAKPLNFEILAEIHNFNDVYKFKAFMLANSKTGGDIKTAKDLYLQLDPDAKKNFLDYIKTFEPDPIEAAKIITYYSKLK